MEPRWGFRYTDISLTEKVAEPDISRLQFFTSLVRIIGLPISPEITADRIEFWQLIDCSRNPQQLRPREVGPASHQHDHKRPHNREWGKPPKAAHQWTALAVSRVTQARFRWRLSTPVTFITFPTEQFPPWT